MSRTMKLSPQSPITCERSLPPFVNPLSPPPTFLSPSDLAWMTAQRLQGQGETSQKGGGYVGEEAA